MKKKIILLLVLFMPFMANAYTGLNNVSEKDCFAFADPYRNIAGTYEYKYCYRAACSTARQWTLANMSASTGYRCVNGNTDPKVTTSSGCTSYAGTCEVTTPKYCTVVKKVECNLKSDGSEYSNPNTTTTTTTTKKSQQEQPKPDKSSSTTKKSTTTKKRTSGEPITIKTKTSSTVVTKPVISTEPITEPTEPVISNNPNVKKIIINGKEQTINADVSDYDLKLPYGVTSVDIKVETESSKAKVEIIGAENMSDEDSDIFVKVTAEDGTEKVLILHVKRYYQLSEDCTLKSIKVNGENINNFDKETYKYNVKINKNVESLTMDAEPSDMLHSTYEVIGNKNLKNKSKITINVTAENGDVCSYVITVKKPSGIWIPIIIIIIVVGILIGIGYYVYGYMKRSKDQYKYE